MYTQICSAEAGWFFVQDAGVTKDKPILQRVAAWAITDEGHVVGLIGAVIPKESNATSPFLTPPPSTENGQYKHFRDLTTREQEALKESNRPHRGQIG